MQWQQKEGEAKKIQTHCSVWQKTQWWRTGEKMGGTWFLVFTFFFFFPPPFLLVNFALCFLRLWNLLLCLNGACVQEKIELGNTSQLVTQKSTGPDRLLPSLLGELANVIMRRLSRRGHGSKVCCRNTNFTSVVRKGKKELLGSYRLLSFTSDLGQIMKQILLEGISRWLKKVPGNSQCRFTKGKSCMPCVFPAMKRVIVLFTSTLARHLTQSLVILLVWLNW